MKTAILSIGLVLPFGFSGAVAGEPAPTPPALRLPRTFLPTSYAARLVVTPTAATFTGRVEIEGELTETSQVIWLNAQDLTFEAAVLTTTSGARVPLEVLPAEKQFVAFRAAAPIPTGALKLSIDYGGAIDPVNAQGVFREEDEGAWYAFTQFEATDARRAFPCFDEPDVKVPWQITLEVPADSIAVSNTPLVSETQAPGGARIFTFARTRPLPSYLIAFAVGPFELIDAGRTRAGAPLRVVAPRGHTGEAKWTVEATLPLLGLLEDYFGTPYPYEKLDMVAIPKTLTFTAMENPGMITYVQSSLLQKEEESTISHRRRYAEVAAHEMAHQWFGDLVTMRWWDDVWLNEAFATWMAGKIVTAWKPEWDGDVDVVETKISAMGSDNLKTARKIHQPIDDDNDIQNAFDGITYSKGAAVIRNFELWVGSERFQKGIRKYLADHAWKNATSSDFLAAIGQTAGVDVATPFATFLDQVGTPLVSFRLACGTGSTPTLKLTQQRYLPVGSTASADELWQVPVCVRYAVGAHDARACTLMTAASAELPLTEATNCPAWVLPNAGGIGYYRMRPEDDLLSGLLVRGMKRLTLPERVGLVDDVEALVNAGGRPAAEALALVEPLARDTNRHIVGAAVDLAYGPDEIVTDAVRPNYARFVRRTFGARARSLGWTPKKGESEDTRILRKRVVGLAADKGEDPELIAEATRLAWAWLDDHKAVAPDIVSLVLDVAVHNGDEKLYQRLFTDAKKATELSERERLLDALGGFRDPRISRTAMGLLLTDDFDPREVGGVMFAGLNSPRTRRQVYEFVKSNFDTIEAKIPRDWVPYLVYSGTAQCDASLRRDVEEFFKSRVANAPGGPRILAQALEQMDLCIAGREAKRPSMEAFLAKY